MESNQVPPMDYSDLINEEWMDENGGAPSEKEMLRRNMMTALGNIVNNHVIEPEVQNTPVGFGNPWLRPLTTLKRFVWASYNTFIPRLYKEFIKDGNVSMRYDAFVTMMAMYLFSDLTNSMKDLISWGDVDKHEKMGFYKRVQRNIYSSGLLGPVNPALDIVAPAFGDPFYGVLKKDRQGQGPSVLDIANNIAKEHSPLYSYLSHPAGAVIAASQGKTQQAIKEAAKSTVLNTFPGFVKSLAD